MGCGQYIVKKWRFLAEINGFGRGDISNENKVIRPLKNYRCLKIITVGRFLRWQGFPAHG